MSAPGEPKGVCPVQHVKPAAAPAPSGGCPVKHDLPAPTPAGDASACPVSHEARSGLLASRSVYRPLAGAPAFPAARKREESSQAIVGDIFPDSKPSPGQRLPLSAIPAASSIPKSARAVWPPAGAAAAAAPAAAATGAPLPPPSASSKEQLVCDSAALAGSSSSPASAGAGAAPGSGSGSGTGSKGDETWTFPSQQRFYNAMVKKGWDPKERDMLFVVSIHNTINERSWRQVLEYERLHASECKTPALMKFMGKPDELSIKAQLRSYLGYAKPFDRHDWIVDRCGKDVRYILDFYDGASTDPSVPASTYIDVRPAPTVEGVIDRARVWVNSFFQI